jgi:hypothetical protein
MVLKAIFIHIIILWMVLYLTCIPIHPTWKNVCSFWFVVLLRRNTCLLHSNSNTKTNIKKALIEFKSNRKWELIHCYDLNATFSFKKLLKNWGHYWCMLRIKLNINKIKESMKTIEHSKWCNLCRILDIMVTVL